MKRMAEVIIIIGFVELRLWESSSSCIVWAVAHETYFVLSSVIIITFFLLSSQWLCIADAVALAKVFFF